MSYVQRNSYFSNFLNIIAQSPNHVKNAQNVFSLQKEIINSEVMRMVEYVRGSKNDKWHWCKNCTQYPMFIYQKTPMEPPSDFCEQCKTKEKNRNCVL